MRVSLLVTGRFYHHASNLPDALEMNDGADIEAALSQVNEALGNDALPTTCLIAVNGKHLGTVAQMPSHELQDGDELTLIAPVAGG